MSYVIITSTYRLLLYGVSVIAKSLLRLLNGSNGLSLYTEIYLFIVFPQ